MQQEDAVRTSPHAVTVASVPTDLPAFRVLTALSEVPAAAWDALLPENPPPFVRHAWLAAMEESGSAAPERGWEPSHLTLWRGSELIAASPAYRKSHSMGEYIYDFAWAHAAERAGLEYYPKLIVGAPLSPATSPRLLVAKGEPLRERRLQLAAAAIAFARETGCSSVHFLYPTAEEADLLESELGLARRLTLQFHWSNAGYATYDDYLARFDSKRRHQLRRERAAAARQNIQLRTRREPELTPEHALRAYGFYEATCEKFSWGQLQLTPDFFARVFRTLPSVVEMVEAEREGKVIAGAFNLATETHLYGRYWGCFEEHPFLHFNVCLYHSIDDCIRAGRKVFEPGAGGEHKVTRGFVPTGIHSLHAIFHPKLDAAIRAFVRRERQEHQRIIEEGEALAGMR